MNNVVCNFNPNSVMSISSLARPCVLSLSPYSSARDEFSSDDKHTLLDANENPYDSGFNRYPDPHQRKLKASLAEVKGVPAANIFIGNGSDEVIDLTIRAFCEPQRDNIVSISPTYGMYKTLADINNVEYRCAPLQSPDFSMKADALLALTDANTKMIIICSPNNPTGNDLGVAGIFKLLAMFSGLVCIDEAYIDFAGRQSWAVRLSQFERLVVWQTLSKAWGLAGLRLGMMFASEEVLALLNKIKPPYNINTITQREAIKSLQHPKKTSRQSSVIVAQRGILEEGLKRLPYIRRVYHSDANFLLVKVQNPQGVYDYLRSRNIVVRNRSNVALCEGCIRVTIGTPQENDALLAALFEYGISKPASN